MSLPAQAPVTQAWGPAPSVDYEALAQRFRPIFQRIREGAIAREVQRTLPVEQIEWLRAAGFTALRVPTAFGGSGIQLVELFALLVELGEADSNVVQALRAHMSFVENLLYSADTARRDRWLKRLGEGAIVGGARSESGEVPRSGFSTQLERHDGRWRLNGVKFYTTGSLYADWIDVGVSDPEGRALAVTVRRDTPGVEVIDDWNGFGQTLTASGTARFTDVEVEDENIHADTHRFRYSPAFLQTVHLANLAGMGRALSGEAAAAVAQRTRTFSHGNAPRVAADAQILQVIGQVRSAAYCAGAIVAQVAAAIQRAEQAHRRGIDEDQAVTIAELETAQSQTLVTQLILDASTRLFDALGASATLQPQGLDRFWRNARTLSSHNPRVYKDRIVGDFAVNGTLPPTQWRIGVSEVEVATAG
jgi:alkylation response protein AidB-like acyl-CoA dehydrogenase